MIISDLSYLEAVEEFDIMGGLYLPGLLSSRRFFSLGISDEDNIEELKKSLPEDANVAEAPGVFAASGSLAGGGKFAVAVAQVSS